MTLEEVIIEELLINKEDANKFAHKKENEQIKAYAIEEYKEQLLEYLIPLKDKYFVLAKESNNFIKRYAYLKRMDTIDTIIEMVKIKAEQLKKED